MLHLAPVKYANCFESEGGPLHSIEESKIEMNGERLTVANATLADNHRSVNRRQRIFAPIDGTGLDRNPATARYKAISEAVERWAHHDMSPSPEGKRYGFGEDPTSNGMSAFPGLLPRQARQFALNEAIERFSLIAWWEGLTSIEEVGVTGSPIRTYLIHQPFKNHKVVITRRETSRGYTVFGYGCSKHLAKARDNAIFEMERSNIMLETFFYRNPGFELGDLSTISDYMERRLVYFSMPEGVAAFEERVSNPPPKDLLEKPKVYFDGEIGGPWSSYATVWRIAFVMPTTKYLDPNCLFFYL
jgi:hypothetical protein